jgi:ketosteroid isomerase-like protein
MSTGAQVASLAHVAGTLPDGHRNAQALALKLCERLGSRDLAGASALIVSKAAVDFGPAGTCGSFSEEGAKFFRDLITAFPDLRLTVHSVVGDSETAVIEITVEGTQGADFLGIHNQEKHIDVDQAWVITAAHGRITSIRAYWCQTQLYRRLGVKRLDQISITG